MRATLLNQNEAMQSHPSRNYISLSPKTSTSTYGKPIMLNYNSPKNENQKNFGFPSTINQTASKYLNRTDKIEFGLERKNSKQSNEATPKNATLNPGFSGINSSSRLNAKVKLPEDKHPSVEKYRNGTIDSLHSGQKYPSAPRISESLNLRDLMKKEKKKLEISTEYSSPKIATNISQTTKNKDTNERIPNDSIRKNVVSHMSFEFVSKFSKHGTPSNKTINLEERSGMKLRGSGPLNRTNLAQEKVTPYKVHQDPNGLKVNNFFNNTGTYDPKRGEKSSNMSHVTNDVNTTDDSINKTLELNKKGLSKTQLDLKGALKGISTEDPSNKNNEPPTQKVSLNQLVKQVNRGEAFPTAKKSSERDESGGRKPYLVLEDKSNKTPKNSTSNLLFKGPKTTTNQETKVFVFSNNKLVPQNESDRKKTNKSTTPLNRSQSKENHEVSEPSTPLTPMDRKPFVYWMTNLEKYHKSYNENDYFSQIYREHYLQTYQAMMFCKFLKNVDPKVLAQKRAFLQKRESHKDKKTLVFDLDETLIHCNESLELPYDVKLPIKFPHGEVIEAGINVRPYARDILMELSQVYEIIVFTASHSCYANVVLDYLDPKGQYIHHRLFRESCVVTDEGIYIKDLRVLANRNLQDVVLVDNAAYSFGYQIENGIPIVPFYENKNDQELRYLIPYLKFLASVKDLREINKQTFRLHMYSLYDSPDKVLEKVVFNNK